MSKYYFRNFSLKLFVAPFVFILGFSSIGFCSQVVLVTGASRGIGASIANRLANNGYVVYAGVRDNSTRNNLQASVRPIVLDVTDDSSVNKAVQKITDEEGHVDVLINNAGVMSYGSHENIRIDEAKWLFDVNYFGVLRVTQAVLEGMRERKNGQIIQIGSRSGFRPLPALSVYADSKAALLSASKVMAANLKPWNIKVSVVEPGPVLTELDANSPYGTRLEKDHDPYYEIFGAADLLPPPPGAALGPGAQEPEEIAEIVQRVIETPSPSLRYQTTDSIRNQAAKRAVDPTGDSDVEELVQILRK